MTYKGFRIDRKYNLYDLSDKKVKQFDTEQQAKNYVDEHKFELCKSYNLKSYTTTRFESSKAQ